MRGLRRIGGPRLNSGPQLEADDWLDREIASLQQSVEQPEPGEDRSSRSFHRRRVTPTAASLLSAEGRFLGAVLESVQRSVHRHRFVILVYGFCILSAAVAGWLIASLTK
jgi:hypothetical protein